MISVESDATLRFRQSRGAVGSAQRAPGPSRRTGAAAAAPPPPAVRASPRGRRTLVDDVAVEAEPGAVSMGTPIGSGIDERRDRVDRARQREEDPEPGALAVGPPSAQVRRPQRGDQEQAARDDGLRHTLRLPPHPGSAGPIGAHVSLPIVMKHLPGACRYPRGVPGDVPDPGIPAVQKLNVSRTIVGSAFSNGAGMVEAGRGWMLIPGTLGSPFDRSSTATVTGPWPPTTSVRSTPSAGSP